MQDSQLAANQYSIDTIIVTSRTGISREIYFQMVHSTIARPSLHTTVEMLVGKPGYSNRYGQGLGSDPNGAGS